MAIVSRQEYADMIGIDVKILNVDISRKKVATLPDKRIDTENPLNKIYTKIKKRANQDKAEAAKAQKKAQKVVPETAAKPTETQKLYEQVVEVYTKPETPDQQKARQKQNDDDQDLVDWKARKERADAIKAEHAANLEELKLEKMSGNLIPWSMAEQIITMNNQNFLRTFEGDAINLASIYCDILAGGNRDKLAELVFKIREYLQVTKDRVEETSLNDIENLIENYAEVRSRGERK